MATNVNYSLNAVAIKPQKRLALVSFNSLGDSLIYIMMAENLRQNGYALTLFGDIPFQLREWLPQLAIMPYPQATHFEHSFDDYPLAIVSPPRFLRERLQGELLQRLRQKWLLLCQKAPKDWSFDHQSRLRAELSPTQWQHFAPLARAGSSIHYRKFKSESVVEMTLAYLHECMGLNQVSRFVSLTPPAALRHRCHAKRIVVSPDSAWPEKKDWSEAGFLRLCKLLQRQGYEPCIVVAPDKNAHWTRLSAGRYPVPEFASVAELAAFIYESGAVIANDSGNGHLASFLNIPVVTLYRKRNPKFHWRPDWHAGRVVCPWLVLPTPSGQPCWRPFIRPGMVLRALNQLLRQPSQQRNRQETVWQRKS